MQVTFEERDPQPILGLRRPVQLNGIAAEIGRWMPTLMKTAGPHASGPLVARYLEWEHESGVLELAVPVASDDVARDAAKDADRVEAASLPGGRCAVVEHHGPYAGLAKTWRAFQTWLGENGHACRDDAWEEYVNDCATTLPADLITRIVWPVDS